MCVVYVCCVCLVVSLACDTSATSCFYSRTGLYSVPYRPALAVGAVGRMCSSLRNSLVLLAGEGGPGTEQNKDTSGQKYALCQQICVCVCTSVCVRASDVGKNN